MSSQPKPEGLGGGGRFGGRRGRGGRQDGGGRSSGGNGVDTGNKKGRGGRGSKGGRGRSGDGNASGGQGGRGGKKPSQPSPAQLEKQKQEEEEKKRQEAEKERKLREKKLQEAVTKRKNEILALEEKMRNAIETVKQFVDINLQRQASRTAMTGLAESRKQFESNKKNLKTDLKKCTAFVKKIKSGSAWSNSNIDSNEVLKDVSILNLSRYVDEIVTAIIESKPKIGDLIVIVALCQAMHLRYSDFLPNLVRAIWGVINISNKNDPETAKLRRVYLRMITQLHLSGLSVDVKPIVKVISEAAGAKDGTYNVQDANILVAFAKAASPDIFQVTPTSVHTSLEFMTDQLDKQSVSEHITLCSESTEQAMTGQVGEIDEGSLPPLVVSAKLLKEASSRKTMIEHINEKESIKWNPDDDIAHKMLADHCKGAFRTLSSSLVQTHIKLQKLEKRCEQDRLLAGSLTDAREKGLEDARKLKESLQKTVEALADVMALSLPHLPEDEETDLDLTKTTGVEVWTKGGDDEADACGPFDDEETRSFYCDIPDLLTTIPPALLGMTSDDIERKTTENAVKYGAGMGSVETNEDMTGEITPSEAQFDAVEAEAGKNGGTHGDETFDEGAYFVASSFLHSFIDTNLLSANFDEKKTKMRPTIDSRFYWIKNFQNVLDENRLMILANVSAQTTARRKPRENVSSRHCFLFLDRGSISFHSTQD